MSSVPAMPGVTGRTETPPNTTEDRLRPASQGDTQVLIACKYVVMLYYNFNVESNIRSIFAKLSGLLFQRCNKNMQHRFRSTVFNSSPPPRQNERRTAGRPAGATPKVLVAVVHQRQELPGLGRLVGRLDQVKHLFSFSERACFSLETELNWECWFCLCDGKREATHGQ